MAKAKPVHHHDTRRVGLFAAKSLEGGGSEYRERGDSIVSLQGEERVRKSVEPVSLYEHPGNCMKYLRVSKLFGVARRDPGVGYIAVEVLRTDGREGMMPLMIHGAIAMASRWARSSKWILLT